MLSGCLLGTTQSMPAFQKWVMCLLVALFLISVGCHYLVWGSSSSTGVFISYFLVYYFVTFTGEVTDIAGSLGLSFLGVFTFPHNLLLAMCSQLSSEIRVTGGVEDTGILWMKKHSIKIGV